MRKKKFTGRNRLPLVTLVSCCLSLSSHAQSAEPTPIGTVIFASGDVHAKGADGSLRTLTRRSPVFERDTIIVGSSGVAHLRMVDSATIALRPDTEFTFDAYKFDGDANTPDSAVMELLRGGFRAISGSIGHTDHDKYKLETPYASIGVRGTTHVARIVDGHLFTSVEEGGTTITNSFGSIDIGTRGSDDFSETDPGHAPHGLILEPPELNANTFFEVGPVEKIEKMKKTAEKPAINRNTVNARATRQRAADKNAEGASRQEAKDRAPVNRRAAALNSDVDGNRKSTTFSRTFAPAVLYSDMTSFFDSNCVFDVQWGLCGSTGAEALTYYQQLTPVPGGFTSSVHSSTTATLLWASVAPKDQHLDQSASHR
jgi:hypothetical protein